MCAAAIASGATAGGRQQPTEPSELGRAELLQPDQPRSRSRPLSCGARVSLHNLCLQLL